MLRTGRVVSSKEGQMEVCFERPEMCEKCGACGQKHEALFTLAGNARVGDEVDVEMPEKKILGVSFLLYALPLLGLLAGLFLGRLFSENELVLALCGIFLMAVCYIFLKLTGNTIRNKPEWNPQVIAVRSPDEIKEEQQVE